MKEPRRLTERDKAGMAALMESLLPPEQDITVRIGRPAYEADDEPEYETDEREWEELPPLPLAREMPRRDPGMRRARSLSMSLVRAGKARPVVHVPASGRKPAGSARSRRSIKLPPVWLIANVVILLVMGVAIGPRIVHVDAAAACNWHTVVPGDTLGNLGWAHHTNALAIARANHIANPDLIYVGQRICIPTTSWAQAPSAPARPAPADPPTFGSATNVHDFIKLALPYAQQAHAQTGWPTSVILAQWGLEHGWKIPSFTGFNWGNVAALPGEPTVNGTAVPGSPPRFAYAGSPETGVTYYVRVARLGYYHAVAPTARQYGAEAAARALGRSPWDAGHYTDHHDPGSSLVSIMRVYNLFWYDNH